MSTVTISNKYKIVIPKEIREAIGLKPGQRAHIFQYENRIELIPVKEEIIKMRGLLKGIDTTVEREKDR